jgi:hypothetical protein
MNAYTFHSYGKSGSSLAEDIKYLQNSIDNSSIPIIITEHNSHTSSDWNTINSTPDSDYEATKLASQIINIIQSNVKSHYVFKFSITPSFSSTRDVAMNGLHWGEIYNEPFDLADTTLSAEMMRLLTTKLIKSKLYSIGIEGDDRSIYRNYVLARSPNDPFYSYIYIINDRDELVNLNINLNQLNLIKGAKIFIEQVGNGYWNEISNIIDLNSNKTLSNVLLNSFTTLRIAVPNLDFSSQNQFTTNALYSCTLKAGANSNLNECSSILNHVGTSNTYQHENTCVGLIKFKITNINNARKSILKLNIENVISSVPTFSDMTLLVLGLRKSSINLNQYSITWNKMSFVLNKLDSGSLINSVSKNFINWASIDDIQIVGHINVRWVDMNVNKRERMIDVSDYVDKMKNLDINDLTFLIYRPYRHPAYKTGYGSVKADDLSSGALVKFYSALDSNSNLRPQLIQF